LAALCAELRCPNAAVAFLHLSLGATVTQQYLAWTTGLRLARAAGGGAEEVLKDRNLVNCKKAKGVNSHQNYTNSLKIVI
jgi:hypothetical protein